MITKIQGEAPFQVLTNNFSISPSQEGYTLQISADGVNYSNLFSVGANVTRLVTGVAANSYYRLLGNASEVTINWMKTCVTEGGGGSGSTYTAGEYISIEQDVISVTGITPDRYLTTADTQDFATKEFVTGATEEIYETMETKEEVVASALTELHNQVLEISGSTGGGNIVELTKAQYEALDPPEEDTLYIITDADAVDLDDYAQTSAVTQLVQGKADKQNISENLGNWIFPLWNTQGVITGEGTQVYQYDVNMNGQFVSKIINPGYGGLSFYAPTSGGNAGEPLLSNGNGEPVWGDYKFAFITQTQYDALTTPDSTTIYFIIGD